MQIGLLTASGELSGNGYGRVTMPMHFNGDRKKPALNNPLMVYFPVATAPWGPVTEIALYGDDGSLKSQIAMSPQTFAAGSAVTFPSRSLVFELALKTTEIKGQ